MGHYAKVVDNLVTKVIVAKAEFFDDFVDDTPGEWIKTSYNTVGGKHHTQDEEGLWTESADQSKALRKNFAGRGFTYDREKDAFIPPKPYTSWVLNDDTCLWEAPVDYPDDGEVYAWNETITNWTLVTKDPV